MFLALIASKKHITCRIRVDPARFKDEEKRTRELKGWFFKGLRGVEKAFKIASATDIEQTMSLISQSYEFVKWIDSV